MSKKTIVLNYVVVCIYKFLHMKSHPPQDDFDAGCHVAAERGGSKEYEKGERQSATFFLMHKKLLALTKRQFEVLYYIIQINCFF